MKAALLLATLALAGFGPADNYEAPAVLAAPPPLPAGYDEAHALRLGLADALELAMKQNLGIRIERQQVAASRLGVKAATWSLYEPTVSAGYTRDSTSGNTWSASVSQHLPTGGDVSIGESESATTLSVRQPLFRGFSWDGAIPQYAILTAKIASEQERYQLAVSAAALVEEVEGKYWNVVLQLYSYGVAVKSKQLAADTVTVVRRKIAVGMVSSSDLTGAENTLAQRELAVLASAQAVEASWDDLRTVLNLPRDQWDRPVLPTDQPQLARDAEITPEAAFAIARDRRPELAQSALDLEASTLSLRKTENDGLPQIDVGLNTSVAHRDTPDATSPLGWSVTASLSWTPTGRARKVNREIARIQHSVRVANQEERVQGVWNEVRGSVRSLRAAGLEVVAAAASRKLATEALAIETRKYASGSSSNLELASLQSGLVGAEVTELQALLAHERARTALLRATGQLLEHRHIELRILR